MATLRLALAMVIAPCVCSDSANTGSTGESGTAEGGAGGLQSGYSKVNITPHFFLGLAGYSYKEIRRSEGFVDYIYATYIPTKEAYAYRSYEADTGYYAAGTAEALAENYVKMLEIVKQ